MKLNRKCKRSQHERAQNTMKLQINTTSNKRHISQHWTDTTSNPVTDTARHNFIYNTDTTASLEGSENNRKYTICEAVIPQEKKTPSLHYHTAQKLHGHTFSSVNPRAIFTNTATCCGSGNVPALSGLAGMSLRQAAGPLCLSVSVGTDMLTSDRTDSWQEGVLFFFGSLTVYLGARPLSSGLFVGGPDGVSDTREGLKQTNGSS